MPSELLIPNFYPAVYVMCFTHKSNIVRGLVVGDNNIFVTEERQVFNNI